MALRTFLQAACLLLSTALPAVGIKPSIPIKQVQQHADAKSLARHLRAMGYKTRGGVDQAASDRDREGSRSFPHFASSFTVGGTTYPFAMVGNTPASGRTAQIKSVIVPLRMNFAYFGVNQDISHSFEPAPAVTNTVGSPIYVPAAFPNGFGQFGDQMQRAAF